VDLSSKSFFEFVRSNMEFYSSDCVLTIHYLQLDRSQKFVDLDLSSKQYKIFSRKLS